MNEAQITVEYNDDMRLFYLQVDKTQIVLTYEEMRQLDFQVTTCIDSHLRSQEEIK